jgi:hypothetical protein
MVFALRVGRAGPQLAHGAQPLRVRRRPGASAWFFGLAGHELVDTKRVVERTAGGRTTTATVDVLPTVAGSTRQV